MNAFRTKLLVGLFVPALALGAGVASATGDTSKVTGQAATNGSTNTNDKSSATTSNTTGMSSSKSSTASAAFARLDTNHDGKLSAAEAAADPKVQGMWKKLDANNDGSVSQAEFAAHQAELK
jgi:hypothetical protein